MQTQFSLPSTSLRKKQPTNWPCMDGMILGTPNNHIDCHWSKLDREKSAGFRVVKRFMGLALARIRVPLACILATFRGVFPSDSHKCSSTAVPPRKGNARLFSRNLRFFEPLGTRSKIDPLMKRQDAAKPRCIIIAGPNGAGKTTFAREFLPKEAGVPRACRPLGSAR